MDNDRLKDTIIKHFTSCVEVGLVRKDPELSFDGKAIEMLEFRNGKAIDALIQKGVLEEAWDQEANADGKSSCRFWFFVVGEFAAGDAKADPIPKHDLKKAMKEAKKQHGTHWETKINENEGDSDKHKRTSQEKGRWCNWGDDF